MIQAWAVVHGLAMLMLDGQRIAAANAAAREELGPLETRFLKAVITPTHSKH